MFLTQVWNSRYSSEFQGSKVLYNFAISWIRWASQFAILGVYVCTATGNEMQLMEKAHLFISLSLSANVPLSKANVQSTYIHCRMSLGLRFFTFQFQRLPTWLYGGVDGTSVVHLAHQLTVLLQNYLLANDGVGLWNVLVTYFLCCGGKLNRCTFDAFHRFCHLTSTLEYTYFNLLFVSAHYVRTDLVLFLKLKPFSCPHISLQKVIPSEW